LIDFLLSILTPDEKFYTKDHLYMSRLNSLKETRASKVDALKAIAARAEAERRDLTSIEQTEFDTGRSSVDQLDRELRNAEFLADMERRADAEPITGNRGGMVDLESRYSVGKALAEFSEHGRLTGAEAEFQAEHRSGRPGAITMPTSLFLGSRETRALTTTTPVGGVGGNMIATNQGQFIDRLRPTLAVEALGATVLSGLTGNLDLPRLKNSGTAGWVGEHSNATRSDASFDKVSMGPKTVAAEYEISRRMMLQATQIESILRSDLGFLLAQSIDAAAIKGGGANEPSGILSAAGVPTVAVGANGGPLTLDLISDLIGAIDDANVIGNCGFLTNSKVRKGASKMKDAQNRPYGVPSVFQNEAVSFSNQVPANLAKGSGTNLSAIIYGAWSDLIIGYWSSVDIVVNPYHGDVASKGGALLHAFLDADLAFRHVESFAVCKDVSA
jgi:HK97 family phage major capsid protein